MSVPGLMREKVESGLRMMKEHVKVDSGLGMKGEHV